MGDWNRVHRACKEALNIEVNDMFEVSEVIEKLASDKEALQQQLILSGVSHSMTGDGMNCLEFFDMIKKEWCLSDEQYTPFWNDVLTFARKYHKERKEYCG